MKVFTREELELVRLEASRERIANLRAKLQQMKNLFRPGSDLRDRGDDSSHELNERNRRE